MIKRWLHNRQVDATCMKQIIREQSDIRVIDLWSPNFLGPTYDSRAYVAVVGLFFDGTFDIDIPKLFWYCRQDGNIWGEWYINESTRRGAGDTMIYHPNVRGSNNTTLKFTAQRPMSRASQNYINSMTKELWTMHKMTSDTLL